MLTSGILLVYSVLKIKGNFKYKRGENMSKESNINFDSDLRLRINKEDLSALKIKALEVGKPYQMLVREFITAFNEDRLTIKVDESVLKHYTMGE